MDDLGDSTLLQWQGEQYKHDKRNHVDIVCLHKNDRLKHYGLHFAKYVGRLARGSNEKISYERIVVDTALVCLSAANTLLQRLEMPGNNVVRIDLEPSNVNTLADAAGRFADACEKIDHMEEFVGIAKRSNQDVMNWVLSATASNNIDLPNAMRNRRRELAERQFYIMGEKE